MNQAIVNEIFELCIIPILAILTAFFVNWIKKKANEIKVKTNNDLLKKYTDMLAETINACVIATNQTYVDSLKEKGAFDKEAQKEAFNKTYNAVLDILADEAKQYLTEIYGDFDTFLKQSIEAEVNIFKIKN